MTTVSSRCGNGQGAWLLVVRSPSPVRRKRFSSAPVRKAEVRGRVAGNRNDQACAFYLIFMPVGHNSHRGFMAVASTFHAAQTGFSSMFDILYVVIGVAVLGACAVYTVACDNL
jgi:hypothetical protein